MGDEFDATQAACLVFSNHAERNYAEEEELIDTPPNVQNPAGYLVFSPSKCFLRHPSTLKSASTLNLFQKQLGNQDDFSISLPPFDSHLITTLFSLSSRAEPGKVLQGHCKRLALLYIAATSDALLKIKFVVRDSQRTERKKKRQKWNGLELMPRTFRRFCLLYRLVERDRENEDTPKEIPYSRPDLQPLLQRILAIREDDEELVFWRRGSSGSSSHTSSIEGQS